MSEEDIKKVILEFLLWANVNPCCGFAICEFYGNEEKMIEEFVEEWSKNQL